MASRSMRPPKPVSSCRPINIHSSESSRGVATIIASSSCSLPNDDSASASGWAATLQMAVRMGMLEDLEPLLVHGGVAFDDHVLAGNGLQLREQRSLARLEPVRHFGVDAQGDRLAFDVARHLSSFRQDLEADRAGGLDPARAAAVLARLAEGPLERLLHPLAGERYQAELVNGEDAGGSAVEAQGFLQRLDHFLPVAALVHIDEVDHDDPAQVAQADLAHNLLHRVDIGIDDGVFQAVGLAHVLAGVD